MGCIPVAILPSCQDIKIACTSLLKALNIDKNKQNQALVVRRRCGRPRTTLKSLITSEISVLTQQTTTRRPWRTFWAIISQMIEPGHIFLSIQKDLLSKRPWKTHRH